MFGVETVTRGLTFGKVLAGISKTLAVANQIIPIYQQAKPMLQNARSMLQALQNFTASNNPREKKVSPSVSATKKEGSSTLPTSSNAPTFFA